MTPTIEYAAPFSDSLVDEAARVIARKSMRRMLTPTLRVAMAINVVGFVLSAIFFGNAVATWAMAVLAFVIPLFWPALLVWLPPRFRRQMADMFQPESTVGIAAAGFSVSARGRSWSLPWSDLKAIEEHARFYLFVLAKNGEPVVIPSATMPAAARELVGAAAGRVGGGGAGPRPASP